MPRTFPGRPDFPAGSEAERAVWGALRAQLPENAVLISGQRIAADAVEAEIDLLVLWPDVGSTVIEVTGGQVSLRDGLWYRSGREGGHRLTREQERTLSLLRRRHPAQITGGAGFRSGSGS